MNSEIQMTTSHFNVKPREVWCLNCKKTVISNEVSPICEDCFGKPMITVVYSLIDGSRITGKDELGSTGS